MSKRISNNPEGNPNLYKGMPSLNPKGRGLKFTPEELEKEINIYFSMCNSPCAESLGKKYQVPTVGFLADHLGCTTATLKNYSERPEFKEIMEWAYNRLEAEVEYRLLTKEGSVTGEIFVAKNRFKWTDKRETTLGGELNITKIENIIVDPSDTSSESI